MLPYTHIRTGYTHLHSQSPTHTHSHAETLLTRSVGFSFAFCVCLLGLRFSLVVAAVCGLRCQVTSYQFRTYHPHPPPLVLELGHVHPLPLAYISLALPLPLLLPPCACPFGYKLNFRICLEIHLLNYFATRTQLFPSTRCPPPYHFVTLRSLRFSIFSFSPLANMKNELHLTVLH